jgi:hypothetical protein
MEALRLRRALDLRFHCPESITLSVVVLYAKYDRNLRFLFEARTQITIDE